MRRTLAAALLAAVLIPANAQALENEELLALVAMPLAVAAVSEVTDVPMNDLIDVVSLMNDAAVPPAQFIEVIRYAPVALVVETTEPRFAEFVRVQYDNGLRGSALVNTIEERIQIYGVEGVDLDVAEPRIVDIDDGFLPPVVVNRLAQVRAHPHGGPPGQLKKELGLKTGAEVVHGTASARVVDERREKRLARPRSVKRDDGNDDRGKRRDTVTGNRGRGNGRARVVEPQDDGGNRGRGNAEQGGGKGRGHGGGGGGDHGADHGGGKGKGKGKG